MHFIQHRIGVIKQLLVLIIIAKGDIVTDLDIARSGFKLREYDLEQSRFSDAVWTNEADSFSPFNVEKNIFKQKAIFFAFSKALGYRED